MSSVQQISFSTAVKNQFYFKLKAHYNVIGSLAIFQLIGLILSPVDEMTSITSNHLTITTNIFSGNMIITFTWLWAFIAAIYITNRHSKNMMFSFVSNKLSNHLANFLFMISISAIGAVTAVLLTVAARLGMILYYGTGQIHIYEYVTLSDLFVAILVTFLYHMLIFSFGYFIGEAVQLHKSFVLLVPLLLFALFIFSVNLFGDAYILNFFFLETNIYWFILKVVRTVLFLWLFAIYFGKRLEVRKT